VITKPLSFRAAQAEDAPQATALINAAYRGDPGAQGWTTEAHLLKGRRIDESGFLQLLAEPETLILLCFLGEEMIGSVLLQKRSAGFGYFGMFVVRPDSQGRGVGRHFMREAEQTAQKLWGVTRMTMTVISLRRELIAYYQRRGYVLTGERLSFPFDDGLSVALVDGIDLATLEKDLMQQPADGKKTADQPAPV
jgi:GNAT superfamily N-acetyltransferase